MRKAERIRSPRIVGASRLTRKPFGKNIPRASTEVLSFDPHFVMATSTDPPPADVAILTVIAPELDAARAALGLDPDKSRRKDKFSGTVFLEGSVFSNRSKRDVRVVLACVGGAGNPASSAAASELVLRYQPKVVLLMGIAAGVRDKTKIGDVILSERVVAYEPAALVQEQDGSHIVQPRHEIDRAPHTIQQDVMHYEADVRRIEMKFHRFGGVFPKAPHGYENDWERHVASGIRVQKGITLASGEKLLRDPAKLVELRRDLHGKIEVAEMEAAGLVEACRRLEIPWLVIRGISDFGDEFKHDGFHEFASKAAAVALVDFIEHGLDLGGAQIANTVVLPEAHHVSIKESGILASIENTFWATKELLLNPTNCFTGTKEGFLQCVGVSGFRYWIYLYILEIGLILVATGTTKYFRTWFVIVYLVYGIIRITMLALIWAIVGVALQLDYRKVVSICFFATALGSLLAHLPMLPLVSQYGLPTLLRTDIMQAGGIGGTYAQIALLVLVGAFTYQLLYLSSSLRLYGIKLLAFVGITGAIYGLVRQYTVLPVFLHVSKLFDAPL